MKLLVDMNLSPGWCDVLKDHGVDATHWSDVGDPRAPDHVLMDWARDNDHVVFTHDLDFGAMLAATHATAPSVVQVRTQDIMPATMGQRLVDVLTTWGAELDNGALVVVEEARERVRMLPFADT